MLSVNIELLAKEIQENNNRIKDNDADYRYTYDDESKEKSRLEQQVSEAINRRDQEQGAMSQRLKDKEYEIENETSWVNRRKSAESGWKEYSPGTCSAGGPPPICSAENNTLWLMNEYNSSNALTGTGWAKNTDLSGSGIVMEAGVMLKLGKINVTTGYKFYDSHKGTITFGVGFCR